MGNSIFGIGLSALSAARSGLLVTGHNVSNASTPGYTRQQIVQSTNPAQATGAGFIGKGVKVDTVSRSYNQFLTHQVTQAKTESAQLDTYYAQIQQIDRLLADPNGNVGLAPALQNFFGGVQDIATNPSDAPSRQTMLSGAEVLVRRFQSLDGRLDEIRDGVNTQIKDSVSLINTFAAQIGKLNEAIGQAEGATRNQPANDLRDQRDELVVQLNQEIRTNVVKQDDGSYSILIGSGQPLLVGTQVFQLGTTASPTDARRVEVTYVADGNSTPIRESTLDGGKLGGLLQFRSESLDAARNGLGRVAIGLAGTFNEQHRLGQDLHDNLGGDFFTVPAPSVTSSATNAGSAVVAAAITDYSALTTSDYRLQYDGANYTLTRLTDGVAQTFAAFPQTVDGVSLSLASGTAAAGDEFLIQPTVNGAGQIAVAIQDTALIAAGAPIRTDAPLANIGTGRISAGSVNAPPPTDPNLKMPVTLTFTSATTFDVSGVGTGNPSGVAFTAGGSISYNGWTVQITGSPQPGDTFSIGPNTNGVGDNRNALLLGALQSNNTLAGGTINYQAAYGQVVSQIGNKTRELNVTSAAQTNLVSQTYALQQAESGVNLDEEAANLLRYQQAYQAAGKVIQTAGLMFDTLLALSR
ncbi:MAG: flagellar hook-associated protein FlgK [Nitrosospira sp.]|nr:flagellar hook-associated protein FlgK [Nitrosospira sp.]MDN5935141.1 flagellar hook-associated protein FlgK [Nitrosospira sp.]